MKMILLSLISALSMSVSVGDYGNSSVWGAGEWAALGAILGGLSTAGLVVFAFIAFFDWENKTKKQARYDISKKLVHFYSQESIKLQSLIARLLSNLPSTRGEFPVHAKNAYAEAIIEVEQKALRLKNEVVALRLASKCSPVNSERELYELHDNLSVLSIMLKATPNNSMIFEDTGVVAALEQQLLATRNCAKLFNACFENKLYQLKIDTPTRSINNDLTSDYEGKKLEKKSATKATPWLIGLWGLIVFKLITTASLQGELAFLNQIPPALVIGFALHLIIWLVHRLLTKPSNNQ